jgi:phosphatidylglycerol:prolipoprotein diacylglycerol transferase
MYPVILKLGPITLHSYGLMLAVGFLIGLYFLRKDAVKFGINPDVVSDGAFWTLLVALAGSRILFIIMYPEGFSWRKPLEWFAIWQGGLVFQGAILPAVGFIYYYARRHQANFFDAMDMAVPWVALGHGVGRIGCFLNGCCFGERSDLPWAISFPRVPHDLTHTPTGCPAYLTHVERYGLNPSAELWSFPVHPTQIYGVLGLLAACGILLYTRSHWRPFYGSTMSIYFVLYGLGRFLVEFIRDDGNPVRVAGFTDQQLMAVASVIFGLVLLIVLSRISLCRIKRT